MEIYGKMRNLGTRLKRKNKITDYSNIAASRYLKGYDGMTKILFVCHGNICRSPMAEYVIVALQKNKKQIENRTEK
jgi:low molecular weight phosphotyrosine protein phosphatase